MPSGKPKEPCKDAKEPLKLGIKECHIRAAVPRHPEKCVLALSAKDEYHVEDLKVFENVVKIRFKGDKFFTRYRSTPAARQVIAALDRNALKFWLENGMKFPDEGVEIILRPPAATKTLEYLRSPIHKNRQKKAAIARKKLAAKGIPPRKYNKKKVLTITPGRPDSITLQSIRSGQGYSVKI
jgi:hypothetical protein